MTSLSRPGRWSDAWRLISGLLTGLVLGLAPGLATPAFGGRLEALPALGLSADGTTVSGLSSGGYMAGQFHVAFSASLAGAAVLAAGPYGCSRGSVATAVYQCACPANPGALQRWQNQVPGAGCSVLAPGVLASFADSALDANRHLIDDPQHLARQRVWLFSGGRDEVVRAPLVDAMEAFYRRHGVADANLRHVHVTAAAHGLPVPGAPVACDRTATPYLTRCPGEDAPGQLLAWLYGATPGAPLQPAVAPVAAHLRRFDQQPYRQAYAAPVDRMVKPAAAASTAHEAAPKFDPATAPTAARTAAGPPASFDGLDDSGWLYVPAACQQGGAGCRLHVVFHGCQQSQRALGPRGRPIGRQFVAGAGYNGWAEANRIVVLYPQVRASTAVKLADTYRLNPEGCWDFWGYTDAQGVLAGAERRFARPGAPQMRAVKAMVDRLLTAF